MEAPEQAAERERLRRALYRPGATEADRARYAGAAPEPEPEPEPPSAVPAPRRLQVRTGVGAALVVAGAAAVALVAVPAPTSPTASTPPSRPAADSTPWQPDVRQVGTTYTDAGVVQAFQGRGPATAVLDGDVMPHDGGRLSVVLAPSATALIGWQVRRQVPVDGASDQLIAQRSVTERTGVAMPIVFPFVGGPPTTVRVQAPDDVSWSLVVTSLRGATPR